MQEAIDGESISLNLSSATTPSIAALSRLEPRTSGRCGDLAFLEVALGPM